MVAGPRNHRNRTAVHLIAPGRRAKKASDAAGRGWSPLPIGHEGPGLYGFARCSLVAYWSNTVGA